MEQYKVKTADINSNAKSEITVYSRFVCIKLWVKKISPERVQVII